MGTSEMHAIQVTIEEAKKVIQDRDDIVKLVNNPIFQRVVGKMYYEDESVRLVGLLSEEGLDDKAMAGVHRQMFGISNMQRFLRDKVELGNQMEADLKDAEEEIDRPEGE